MFRNLLNDANEKGDCSAHDDEIDNARCESDLPTVLSFGGEHRSSNKNCDWVEEHSANASADRAAYRAMHYSPPIERGGADGCPENCTDRGESDDARQVKRNYLAGGHHLFHRFMEDDHLKARSDSITHEGA